MLLPCAITAVLSVAKSVDSMVMQGTKLGIASSVRGRRKGEEKTRRRACVCFFFFLSSGERRESRDAQEKFFETADTRMHFSVSLLIFSRRQDPLVFFSFFAN